MDKTAMISMERALGCLRDAGWRPGAIIDLGVAAGTKGLYSVWPEVPICLIEPSAKSLPYMEQIAAAYPNVQIFNVGASNRNGELEGHQHEDMVNVFFGRGKDYPKKAFPVRTCDDIVAEAGVEGPFLYKLDTDSHEREILEGSAATLAKAEVCVIEANVFHGFRGCLSPMEMWQVMDAHGFAFLDIADCSFGAQGVLRGADFVFVRRDAPVFRAVFAISGKRADLIERRAKQYQDALLKNDFL
jgi:FkbM family methyltransferase